MLTRKSLSYAFVQSEQTLYLGLAPEYVLILLGLVDYANYKISLVRVYTVWTYVVPVLEQDANKEVQKISTRRGSSVSMDAVCSSQNTSGSKG